jgi:hypothetical protein
MADTESVADTVRRAAKLLRERTEAVPPGPWTRSRHAPTAGRGPACHVVDAAVQAPHAVGVRVCDTGPYDHGSRTAEFIATLHPGVMLPVADSWEHQADDMADYHARESLAGGLKSPAVGTDVHGLRHDWTATLAAARALLGES